MDAVQYLASAVERDVTCWCLNFQVACAIYHNQVSEQCFKASCMIRVGTRNEHDGKFALLPPIRHSLVPCAFQVSEDLFGCLYKLWAGVTLESGALAYCMGNVGTREGTSVHQASDELLIQSHRLGFRV